MDNYNATIQNILAALIGERDALIRLKMNQIDKDGEAAAMRMILLNLAIDNLDDLVIKPLQEARYR